MPLLLTLLVVTAFGLGALLGAPYLPILKRDRASLLDLVQLGPGDTLLDLGSGDGRLLYAAAARGIRGIGYEINPLLVVISWIICYRYRKLVKIRLANYWSVRLPPADAVYVFLIDRYMSRLDDKLTSEISHPTQVVSFVFQIPGRTPLRRSRNAFVYAYGTGKAHT